MSTAENTLDRYIPHEAWARYSITEEQMREREKQLRNRLEGRLGEFATGFAIGSVSIPDERQAGTVQRVLIPKIHRPATIEDFKRLELFADSDTPDGFCVKEANLPADEIDAVYEMAKREKSQIDYFAEKPGIFRQIGGFATSFVDLFNNAGGEAGTVTQPKIPHENLITSTPDDFDMLVGLHYDLAIDGSLKVPRDMRVDMAEHLIINHGPSPRWSVVAPALTASGVSRHLYPNDNDHRPTRMTMFELFAAHPGETATAIFALTMPYGARRFNTSLLGHDGATSYCGPSSLSMWRGRFPREAFRLEI